MTTATAPPLMILRRKQVETRTGLSRSTIYDKLSPNSPRYDPLFPKAIRLGANSVGWVEAEVEAWLANRVAVSRPPANTA